MSTSKHSPMWVVSAMLYIFSCALSVEPEFVPNIIFGDNIFDALASLNWLLSCEFGRLWSLGIVGTGSSGGPSRIIDCHAKPRWSPITPLSSSSGEPSSCARQLPSPPPQHQGQRRSKDTSRHSGIGMTKGTSTVCSTVLTSMTDLQTEVRCLRSSVDAYKDVVKSLRLVFYDMKTELRRDDDGLTTTCCCGFQCTLTDVKNKNRKPQQRKRRRRAGNDSDDRRDDPTYYPSNHLHGRDDVDANNRRAKQPKESGTSFPRTHIEFAGFVDLTTVAPRIHAAKNQRKKAPAVVELDMTKHHNYMLPLGEEGRRLAMQVTKIHKQSIPRVGNMHIPLFRHMFFCVVIFVCTPCPWNDDPSLLGQRLRMVFQPSAGMDIDGVTLAVAAYILGDDLP
ncbi:hypothetical protein PIB30_022940 [Stylosanthes scabra]|uniref:Uncharacterized protein n=1 Tax=Stylosanthes scabra TaxID=79078 RepID=A0ABU6R9L3_9FABA|nr:hypothetical protein [Stylosanthes scabra]